MLNDRVDAITVMVPAWHEEVKASYENDSILQGVITEKMINMNSWPQYQFTEGILRFKGRTVIGSRGSLRKSLISTAHDSNIGGHADIQNSYRRLKTLFYWHSMKKMVERVVNECDVCKQDKLERVAYPGLLQPLETPGGAWKDITRRTSQVRRKGYN